MKGKGNFAVNGINPRNRISKDSTGARSRGMLHPQFEREGLNLVKLACKCVVAHSGRPVGIAADKDMLPAVLACECYVMRCQLRQSPSQ